MKENYENLGFREGDAAAMAQSLGSFLPAEIGAHGKLQEAAVKLLHSLDRLACEKVIAERAAYFGLEGNAPLKERVLWREGNKFAVAGLRFKNLNKEFPFAHLTLSFIPGEKELPRLLQAVKATFAPIKIRGIALRTAPGLYAGLKPEIWSHAFYARMEELITIPLPGELSAERPESAAGFYPAYKAEYERFFAERPAFLGFLNIEDQEDLDEAGAARLLLCLKDKEGFAGVIAGREKSFYGFPCVYLFELFLAQRWRGKKIAGPLESAFLQNLSTRYPAVYGHISAENPASYRTALALGRRIVETEYFFPSH